MIEKATQPIDDGESQTKAASICIRIIKTVELAEYILLLILWDAWARIPHLELQVISPPATTDKYLTFQRITDRV